MGLPGFEEEPKGLVFNENQDPDFLKLVKLVNLKYWNDRDFVGLFQYLFYRFIKDNGDILKPFRLLVNDFRSGNKPKMMLKFLSECYEVVIVEALKEYSIGADGQCCYSESIIWISNVASTINCISKSLPNMETNLFHEIVHIIIHKTGHHKKNTEKFVDGLAPLIHDYYKENVIKDV